MRTATVTAITDPGARREALIGDLTAQHFYVWIGAGQPDTGEGWRLHRAPGWAAEEILKLDRQTEGARDAAHRQAGDVVAANVGRAHEAEARARRYSDAMMAEREDAARLRLYVTGHRWLALAAGVGACAWGAVKWAAMLLPMPHAPVEAWVGPVMLGLTACAMTFALLHRRRSAPIVEREEGRVVTVHDAITGDFITRRDGLHATIGGMIIEIGEGGALEVRR